VLRPQPGGWPSLTVGSTLQGAPLKLRLGGVFANASRWHDPQPLSPPRGPLRFDLDHSVRAYEIVTEAAPYPILGPPHQTAGDWVSMDVSQLLHKFALAPHVEAEALAGVRARCRSPERSRGIYVVVVTRLPE